MTASTAAGSGESEHASEQLGSAVSLIIPAYNEELALPRLLAALQRYAPGQIIVADNGSTDQTAMLARQHGAQVAFAPQRGYGAACWAGIQALLPTCRVVVFIDADLADDPAQLPRLIAPITAGQAQLVIGSRHPSLREHGAMTPQQHLGNMLATTLIWLIWGYRYADLGPFRAIERSALAALRMTDRAYGWTVEMQVRAVIAKLRIQQLAVPYRRRIGRSKISGTVRGSLLAGYWILRTIAVLAWQCSIRSREGLTS